MLPPRSASRRRWLRRSNSSRLTAVRKRVSFGDMRYSGCFSRIVSSKTSSAVASESGVTFAEPVRSRRRL